MRSDDLPDPYPLHSGAHVTFRLATAEEREHFGITPDAPDTPVVVIRYAEPFVVLAVDRTFVAVE